MLADIGLQGQPEGLRLIDDDVDHSSPKDRVADMGSVLSYDRYNGSNPFGDDIFM